MTRRSDILDTARRVLELAAAEGLTAEPWTQDECVQFDVNGPPGDRGLDGHAVAQTQFVADAAFIASVRTAAPALARFVEMVDNLTSAFSAELAAQGATGIAVAGAIAEVRRRLGLDTTEGG